MADQHKISRDGCFATHLCEDDMIILSYENSLRSDSCIDYLRNSDVAGSVENVILLPIPSTRDNVTILNTKVYINSVIEDVDSETLVCGYGVPSMFKEKAEARGALVFDLSEDESFLLENAYTTAVCTLGIILNTESKMPTDLHIGVVGYGRIGKRLTELLLYIGAQVRVYTSRISVRDELCECGVSSVLTSEGEFLQGLDILINTAPARIFSADIIGEDLRVIDLASGSNFDEGVRVEKYPSIPAKMFPVSAGVAWGKAIEHFLKYNTEGKK